MERLTQYCLQCSHVCNELDICKVDHHCYIMVDDVDIYLARRGE